MLPASLLPSAVSEMEHSKEWPAARSSAFQDFFDRSYSDGFAKESNCIQRVIASAVK